MMRNLIILLLLFMYLLSCESSVNPEETKEEISPKARLDEDGYTKTHLSNEAVLQMEQIASQLCSGEMGMKELLNFTLDGHSIKHFLNADISTFKEKDLEAYSEAREKAKCCLKAITEGAACEYREKVE